MNSTRISLQYPCSDLPTTTKEYRHTANLYPCSPEVFISRLFSTSNWICFRGAGQSEEEIAKIESMFKAVFAQRNAEQYEIQFKDHEITHNKYPQFTPKDCIMWDNSMKHLANKRGVAWKDKTIRQRHIDIIEKIKKEKLSPWEARLVRVS